MMEDDWLCIDEDDASSHHSFSDSDVIDSETEAELYSIIHYEENLSTIKSHSLESEKIQTSEECVPTSTNINRAFSTKNSSDRFVRRLPVSENNVNHSKVKKELPDEDIFLNKLAKKFLKEGKSNSDHNGMLYSNNSKETGLNRFSKQTSLNNKRETETDCNSHKKLKKNKVRIDSTDSDSLTEVELLDHKDFQTNLFEDEDAIYLSSDSYAEPIMSSIRKKRQSVLKNLSMPNIKIGENENSKDLWHINDEDLYQHKTNNLRRYHDTCTNCNKKGHTSEICNMHKVIKCFICGGAHLGAKCANRICCICYKTGHDSKKCWKPYIVRQCKLCNMEGHVKVNCPDIWRRYHLTTQPVNIVQGREVKQDTIVYCCNCGYPGHFGAECSYSRYVKSSFRTWPCVVSYDDPKELLRKRLYSQRNEGGNFRKDAPLNQRNSFNSNGINVIERKHPKKKKKRLEIQTLRDIKEALRERDFPRTPKNNIPPINSDDTMPEFVQLLLKKKKKMSRKQRIRQAKRKLRAAAREQHSLQADM